MIKFYLISILITLIENITIGTMFYNKAKKDNKLEDLEIDYISTIKNVNPLIIVPGVNIVKNILNILTFKEEYNKFLNNNTLNDEQILKDITESLEINQEEIKEKQLKLSALDIWKSLSVEDKKELLGELLKDELQEEELNNVLKLIK